MNDARDPNTEEKTTTSVRLLAGVNSQPVEMTAWFDSLGKAYPNVLLATVPGEAFTRFFALESAHTGVYRELPVQVANVSGVYPTKT